MFSCVFERMSSCSSIQLEERTNSLRITKSMYNFESFSHFTSSSSLLQALRDLGISQCTPSTWKKGGISDVSLTVNTLERKALKRCLYQF